ncbi:MAG: hypothetical protein WD079_06265 [Phycisphaeraceae bacterium]
MMDTHGTPSVAESAQLQPLLEKFDAVLQKLSAAKPFAKPAYVTRVLDVARRVLAAPGGAPQTLARAAQIDRSGIFDGTDWALPERLQARNVRATLDEGDSALVTIELLSELRWLAIAKGHYLRPGISAEHALHFLREVLALNLDHVFQRQTEAAREKKQAAVAAVFQCIVDGIGYENILDQVVEEVWRILRQRPIMVDNVKAMVTRLAGYLSDPEVKTGSAPRGVDRLISALYSPSHATHEDPGIEAYQQRLETMSSQGLQQEAAAFARAMHDTGLVSVYHPVLIRFLRAHSHHQLLVTALGLSSTGSEAYLTFQELVDRLIDEAVYPETSQSVYGLTCLLERGILYYPPVPPALWRQINLVLTPEVEETFSLVYGVLRAPRVHLLAGVLCTLGQPLGIGQGDNPTCQSARALSMWAWNDPDYLLQILAWAARDGEVIVHFEGQRISSRELQAGLASMLHPDLDPVSLVLVPHLDRIYGEMGRQAAGRGEDSHKWINPEFHGWWVNRGFAIAVDIHPGKLRGYEQFLRGFYATYHPYYNGNMPVIHPQPAGVAATDSQGRFIGWHAITILRVALDVQSQMRVYFYNPNNDSGQDWGCGVQVSTENNGEVFGESSLPIAEFASRLYIFHYDPLEIGDSDRVAPEDITPVVEMAQQSWARDRLPA